MKALLVSAVLLLAAAPGFAADRTFDISGVITWVDPNSEGTFQSPEDDFDVDFGDETGFGAALNIFWSDRISTELAVSQIESPFALRPRGRIVNVADRNVNMIPVTAVLQFHLAPGATIDPYLGAGGAYIVFGDVTGDNAGNLALDDIEGDDLGLVLNAGVSFAFGRFAIFGDVKYIPVGSSARGVLNDEQGTETTLEVNPIIVSAGLSLRF